MRPIPYAAMLAPNGSRWRSTSAADDDGRQSYDTTAPTLQLNSWDASAPPVEYLDSARYWGNAPTPSAAHTRPPINDFYLSPVPQAPNWDEVPARATATTTDQLFPEPPNLSSWGTRTAGPEAAEASPIDEATQAQEARNVAAKAFGRREWRAVAERSASSPSDADTEAGDPGLKERMRLNFLDSYYRGTLLGASRLAYLAHLAATPDGPGISPDIKRVREDLRKE